MTDEVWRGSIDSLIAFPEGIVGVDAGLTLTKAAWRADGDGVQLCAHLTGSPIDRRLPTGAGVKVAVTGAMSSGWNVADATIPELDAGARGVRELMKTQSTTAQGDFLLALMGTGTSFAAVRGDAVLHLGGTAMGGGSFAGLARRIDPSLSYGDMIGRAAVGERRNVDMMLTDAYPEGIGRLSGDDFTASHFAKHGGSVDDVLAALLNMHGENIGQIAAGRARVAGLERVVVAGGFVHDNNVLSASLLSMIGLFGLTAQVAPYPGFAGAIGAAVLAGTTGGQA